MKKYNILISFDDNYVDKAMNMLYSLKKYNNDIYFNIYIYYINLSDESINRTNKFCEKYKIGNIIFKKYNANMSNCPLYLGHTTVETYIRLFVPFILDDDVDRMLYLDCDIICNGDISKLYETNLDKYYFAACQNVPPLDTTGWNETMNMNLELPEDNKYINAGVLLINFKKYKKDYSIEQINNFIEKYNERLIMQDQDIINKMFYKKIKLLPGKYNYQINSYLDSDIDKNNILIHYSDSLKPWNLDYNSIIKAKFYYDVLYELGKNDEARNLTINHAYNSNFKNKLDIIIPVYNSSKTLSKALDSIKKQSVVNEIIVYVIDDCSTEKYDEILKKYNKYLNIIYIRLDENKGPGFARNFGTSISKGEYITYLDSDDYFNDKTSIEKLINLIEKTNSDEVRSTFKLIGNGYELDFKNDNLGLHGKLYRRKFIQDNDIKFTTTRSFEDTYFNARIYLSNGIISDLDELTYYWVNNEDSLSNTEKIEDKVYDYLSNIYNVLNVTNLCNVERTCDVILECLSFVYPNYNKCKTIKNEIDNCITKIFNILNIDIETLFSNYNDTNNELKNFIKKFYTTKISFNDVIEIYNDTNMEEKNKILKSQLAEFGENNIIEVPIKTNCGGKNLHIGSGVYINFGLSLVDNGNIYIGDNTFIGPNVNILTLNHAVNPNERALGGIEIKDVIIGKNVWIGAGVIIFPGVTIGDNSVIGAGSIVTKDIPSNVLAYGNPCKVIKNNSK